MAGDKQLTCERCGEPRSRRSKSLCLICYRFKKNPDCSHHWVFDVPQGPTALGVCKLCGERAVGMNSLPADMTNYGPHLSQIRRGPEQAAIREGRTKYEADSRVLNPSWHRVTR